jgi:hypothetical protein
LNWLGCIAPDGYDRQHCAGGSQCERGQIAHVVILSSI